MLDQLPMTNPEARIAIDGYRGLVPHSQEWFAHWERKIDQVIVGEENVDLRGMPLEVVDSIIEAGMRGTSHGEGNLQTAHQA